MRRNFDRQVVSRLTREGAVIGEATIGTNREGHETHAGRRIVGRKRRKTQGSQCASAADFLASPCAYVLVNNRAEGNAPVIVQGLMEMLRSKVPLSRRLTAENADIVARRMAKIIPFQFQV